MNLTADKSSNFTTEYKILRDLAHLNLPRDSFCPPASSSLPDAFPNLEQYLLNNLTLLSSLQVYAHFFKLQSKQKNPVASAFFLRWGSNVLRHGLTRNHKHEHFRLSTLFSSHKTQIIHHIFWAWTPHLTQSLDTGAKPDMSRKHPMLPLPWVPGSFQIKMI